MSRTAIVTGASSFVGHHLARGFADAGWRVVAGRSRPLDAYEDVRRARLDALGDEVIQVELNLQDGAALSALIEGETPELVVHHAGYALDYASPDYDWRAGLAVNVDPLIPLYQALAGGEARVLITGSSAEYSASDNANREGDACWPDTPYGISKLTETQTARILSHRFRVPTRIGRLYIPFGPLDNPRKLLAEVVRGLAEGRPVDLTPCEQRRDFIGVSDVTDAWLRMAADEGGEAFEIFNVSSGEAVRLRDLLQEIARRMGADSGLLRFGARPMRPGDPEISFGANDKAKTRLHWRPRPLGAALERDLVDGTV